MEEKHFTLWREIVRVLVFVLLQLLILIVAATHEFIVFSPITDCMGYSVIAWIFYRAIDRMIDHIHFIKVTTFEKRS